MDFKIKFLNFNGHHFLIYSPKLFRRRRRSSTAKLICIISVAHDIDYGRHGHYKMSKVVAKFKRSNICEDQGLYSKGIYTRKLMNMFQLTNGYP